MFESYDVICVGAGPANLNCAYKLKQENPNLKVLIIEKGKKIQDRSCPAIERNIPCIKCKICSIMEGISGCGAFSDGKYPITNDFGGNLWEKVSKEKSLNLQKQIDDLNHELYTRATNKNDFPRLYSSKETVYRKICIQHNLQLLSADIRHLGTDIGQIIYKQLYKELIDLGVDFLTETEVIDIQKDHQDSNNYLVFIGDNFFRAKYVVLGTGRSGSEWMKKVCKNLKIKTHSNKVDLGIRFECPDEIWNHITKDLYECKIVYHTKTYEDNVRTFCMNPSGIVVTENTKGLITVNGHAYEDINKKTNNTNFALLVSKTLTDPFDDSNEYGEAIVRLSNMLGGGVIVQRYGDLIRGKRSTKERIKNNSVIPTLTAEPGDLSLVLPKRILDDILEMIQALDHLVPGMTNDDNLLYGVELKRYDNVVEVDDSLQAAKNLFTIGDSSGWTHSLSQASASGLYVAEKILSKISF